MIGPDRGLAAGARAPDEPPFFSEIGPVMPKPKSIRWSVCAVTAAAFAGTVAGCRRPANAYIPPPPPEVAVARPERKTVPVTLDMTGTTRGVETVEVRARVRGFVQAKHVEDGQAVKAGDLLFTIDPREFDAAVQEAQAEVAAGRANLRLAEVNLARVRQSIEQRAASETELDRATAERDAAEAQVSLALARLARANLDLEFTSVRAPIDGRLGMRTVEVGQLVGAGEATLLGTIVNDTQVYATYHLEERRLLELYHGHESRRPGEDGRPNLVVLLGMADEEGYPHEGRFHKASNTVDPGTGTVAIEAIFDNPKRAILPGLFVRIRVLYGEEQALLVPDTAVLADQRGRYVLVVNDENVVERRDVTVGGVVDRRRAVKSGLDTDAWIVVNGLQRARPGAPVNAQRPGETPMMEPATGG